MAETIASLAVRIGTDLSGFEKDMKEFNKSFGKLGKQVSNAGQQIGTAFTVAGGAIAAGLGFAVKKAMDFDTEMSRVGAISGSTGSDLQALRQSALDLGASTSKSASEVAKGMELMAAKGYDAQQIIAAMPGVINASVASGEDMALVADTVSSALNAFGLAASDATRVSDVLAMSANTSAAGINDLQYAFKYAAPVAKSLGISMEELAAATGIMADAGMKGEQAGTTLRSALLNLADPPKEAKKAMENLGISVTDSSGKFKPFGDIIGLFSTKLQGMTNAQKVAALSQIFGKEAASGMLSVIEKGPAKFAELTTALQNSSGASKTAAAAMRDNLAGSLDQLSGAAETAEISIGSALSPAIRSLADGLASLVNWFNSLSPQTQQFIAIGLALTAMFLVLIGTLGFLAAALGAVAAAEWAVLLPVLGMIALWVLVIAAVIAVVVVIVKYWDQIVAYLSGVWQSIAATASTVWNGIVAFFQTVWNTIVGVFQAIWGVIGPVVMAGWETIKAIFSAYFQTIWAVVKAAWDVIKTIFATAFLFIYYLVTGQWDQIGALFSAAWEKLKGIVSGLWENLKSIWSSASDTVISNVSSMWDSIVTFFTEAPGKVIAALIDLKDKIMGKWQEMKSDALEMGKNIIRGMIDGIMSMASSLAAKAKAVVQGAVNAAKSVLGIYSPSKVFMEIGGYTAEGFAVGMEDNTGMVRDAGSLLANSAIPTAVQYKGDGASSTENSVVNHYHLAPGSIVIPAKDLEEMRTIQDFFSRFPQVSRAMGGR